MVRPVELLVVALLFAGPLSAQTPWIHVEVEEAEEEDSHVKVNLPLSLVRVALEAAPEKVVSNGRVHLGDADVDVENLRRMWRELQNTGDVELASVENGDETVTVRREGDAVRISVKGQREAKEVYVEVPVEVIDALLSGEGNDLNVLAAVEKLDGRRGDLVRVTDGGTKVRVWIDEKD